MAHGGEEFALDAACGLGLIERLCQGQRSLGYCLFQPFLIALLIVDIDGGVQPLA